MDAHGAMHTIVAGRELDRPWVTALIGMPLLMCDFGIAFSKQQAAGNGRAIGGYPDTVGFK